MEPFLLHARRAGLSPARAAGFSIIELLVVIAIISVISSIIVTHQGDFNRSIVVSNTAYDIALTLRAAETYGIGSRAASGQDNTGYGVDFNRATPNQLTLFVDAYPERSASSVCHPTSDASLPSAKPGNCSYDAGEGERVTTYTIGNGITVADFCAYALGSWSCANSNGSALTSLDIVFSRPNPEPFMSVNGAYSPLFPITSACLSLTSPSGGNRYVSVSSSGQITANAASCP